MARADPHWQQAEGQNVLAVFSGPHAYISPTWYGSENVVPTWNYVAVHVYGTFRAIHDESAATQILLETVRTYEASMPSPWTFDPASDFHRKMVKAIVAFRIEIQRIEACRSSASGARHGPSPSPGASWPGRRLRRDRTTTGMPASR